jgi:ABC-2 type transport system permease protein
MRNVLTLALKDLKLLTRDRFGMFWVLGFPIIYALFFGSIFGGAGGGGVNAMPVAVVDQDQTAGSQAFIERLGSSDAIELEPFDDIVAARDLVRTGKKTAALLVKEGFGDSPGIMFGGDQNNLIDVSVDPSRSAEAGYLQGLLMEAAYRSTIDRFRDTGWARDQVRTGMSEIATNDTIEPAQRLILGAFMTSVDTFLGAVDPELYQDGLDFDSGSSAIEVTEVTTETDSGPSSYEVSFPSAILWGLLGCSAAFSISIVKERIEGTFMRLCVSPTGPAQILAGKGLACFISCSLVIVILLVVANLSVGVRLGQPLHLALAIVSASLCFVGLMMLISVLGRTIEAVGGAGWAIYVVMAMIGGGMIPLMFMPRWLYQISMISPVRWGIQALEGAIWREYSLTEMLLPCGVLVGIGVVAFLVGWRISRRSLIG